MTTSAAAELIRQFGGPIGAPLATCCRAALHNTHPDHGGRREDHARVQAAARLLEITE